METIASTYTTEEPPPFPLTAVDRATLAQTDDEFVPHTWEELKSIIGMGPLNQFRNTLNRLGYD